MLVAFYNLNLQDHDFYCFLILQAFLFQKYQNQIHIKLTNGCDQF